jgi:O-antigen/teichoic acid export membrane protein
MARARTIALNTGVTAAADVLGKVASLGFYAVMARELAQSGFGAYTFALSLAQLLTVFAGFGIDNLIARTVARDRSTAPGLVSEALTVKVTFGLVGVIAAVAVSMLGDYSSQERIAVAILSVAAVTELCGKTFSAAFLGMDDLRPSAAGTVIQRYMTAGVGIAVMLAGGGVVAVSGVYLWAALVATGYLAMRLIRSGVRPSGGANYDRAMRLVRTSFALGVTVIFNTALFRIDTVMLSLFKGNVPVGYYGAAYRLLESTLFISYGFVSALLPTLSRLSRETTPTIAEAAALGFKVIVTMLLPLGAVFVALAEPIVHIAFGKSFDPAVPAVRLLGGAVALYGVSYLAYYVLVAQHRQRVLPIVTAAVLAFNVLANLVAIPLWSLRGAAINTSLSEALLAAGFLFYVLRITGPLPLTRMLVGPVAGCAAIFAVTAILSPGIVALIVAPAVGALVILAVERHFFPADLANLLNVVRRRQAVPDVSV